MTCPACNGDGIAIHGDHQLGVFFHPCIHCQIFGCRCVWAGVRCPNASTQEDGLCDWCGSRIPEQLRSNPNAMFGPDGGFLGLGGRGETHVDPNRTPDACWMPNSGRSVV